MHTFRFTKTILLALALAFSLSTPAFAEETVLATEEDPASVAAPVEGYDALQDDVLSGDDTVVEASERVPDNTSDSATETEVPPNAETTGNETIEPGVDDEIATEQPTGWVVDGDDVRYYDPETGEMATDCELDITGPCAPLTAVGAELSDVTEETPHNDDIEWLFETGVSTGWYESDGTRTFRPGNPIVRQDMAAFLYRLAGSPEYVPSERDALRFSDVTVATPHATEIWWLASTGVSTGWLEDDGSATFRPTNTVVRQDMAAFLYRLAGWPEFAPTDDDWQRFTDVDHSTPHNREILWLTSTGVSTGWAEDDGTFTFRPTNRIVRQDMAAFLHRMGTEAGYEPTASHQYLFDQDGNVVTGWVGEGDDARFYDHSTGALVNEGWIKEDSATWRYVSPDTKEQLKGGVFAICGARYLFGDNGVAQTGWQEVDGARRFFSVSNKAMLTGGLLRVGGAMYLFDDDGAVARGWQFVSGAMRFFDRKTGAYDAKATIMPDGSSVTFTPNESQRMTASEVIKLARMFLGCDSTPFRPKYKEMTGVDSRGSWCCLFASVIAKGWGGAQIEGLPSLWCPDARWNATNAGREVPIEEAREGDIVYFEWNGNHNADHVGFVIGYEGGVLTSIEGNASNKVAVRTRTEDNWREVWIVRPEYA